MNCIEQSINFNKIKYELERISAYSIWGVPYYNCKLKVAVSNQTLQLMKSEVTPIGTFVAFRDKACKICGINAVIDDNLPLGEFEILRKV